MASTLPPVPRRSRVLQDLKTWLIDRDWDVWFQAIARTVDALFLLAADPPRVRYRRTTDQSIPNGTATIVAWNDVAFASEPASFVETSGTITFAQLGGYLVIVQVSFESNGTGVRSVRVIANNVIVAQQQVDAAGAQTRLNLSLIVPVTAITDTLVIQVIQTSGGALNLEGATFPNLVSLTIVRRW